jgi:3-hydroxyisobutyrate dehydrogenase-like beta-hydroxyacid dehydrogenase
VHWPRRITGREKRPAQGSLRRERMKLEEARIGFIGLGAMGKRIARRLIDRGFRLTVYNRTQQSMDQLVAIGATAAENLRALGANSDVIISCVTNEEALLDVYTGARGALAGARRGTIVIEMSTVSPETSRKLAELGRECSVNVLDVPISGSTLAAEGGTLILFGGGDHDAFERCDPIFKALSRQHYYIGGNGSGSAMKLVVNTLLGVSMQAIAEAAALGERIGLERQRMLEVLAKTAVVAPAHQGKLLRAARDDYSPQFPLKLMQKDFSLILELADGQRMPMPATMAASMVNRSCTEFGDLDFSFVIEGMRRRAVAEVTNPQREARATGCDVLTPGSLEGETKHESRARST